jgi:hypothetical protein
MPSSWKRRKLQALRTLDNHLGQAYNHKTRHYGEPVCPVPAGLSYL